MFLKNTRLLIVSSIIFSGIVLNQGIQANPHILRNTQNHDACISRSCDHRENSHSIAQASSDDYIYSNSTESENGSLLSQDSYDSDTGYSSANSDFSDIDKEEMALFEQKLSKVCKALPSYKKTSKNYTLCLLRLYQKIYGEKDGTILFTGDSMAIKEKSTFSSPSATVVTPNYTCTSYVGWNPVTVLKTLKNGRAGELNTLSFNVVTSTGFQSLLTTLITQFDTPKYQKMIQDFFSPEEFAQLSIRYYGAPDRFSTFRWSGWNAQRYQSREFKPDEMLPDHDLMELYQQGIISDAELSFQLSNPKYDIEKKLDHQGGYDLKTSTEQVGQILAKRDIGKERMLIHETTDFYKEITKRRGRPVAGPSGTTFRLLTIGKLMSPALQKTMHNIPEEQMHELLVAQCLAYLLPDDHSMAEVEMAAQDVGIYAEGRSITELFTYDIHYGSDGNEHINQQILNDLMDMNYQ